MASTRREALDSYHAKRDFGATPEPKGRIKRAAGRLYVIQKHAARRLHFDFRLELHGVLKSWAVTRGPSLDPADKRLAVRTEDHPVDYGSFEGTIPAGYGAGTVMLWDRGTWTPKGDPDTGIERGVFKFTLAGHRLQGGFALIRMRPKKREKRENWLLVKERDEFADRDADPIETWTRSVESDRTMSGIEQAKPPSALPRFIEPQLATLRDEPPAGEGWLHEIKYDGYRIQACVAGGKARLWTRNRKDWTHRYPAIVSALTRLPVDSAILDGELVALDASGKSQFSGLQNLHDDTRLAYFVFDLLWLNGQRLTGRPLIERKATLAPLVARMGEPIRYSDHIQGDGERVVAEACAQGLEGIVSKKSDASYRSGRGKAWVKSKCIGNDEFVVVGFRESDKAGRPFSSLLLGEHVGDALVYRGRVGTGFDERSLRELAAALAPLRTDSSPLAETPSSARSRAVWVRPRLVAQVAYTERTPEGRLRHPSFLGLRQDKPAAEVKTMPTARKSPAIEVLGVRLSSPGKVMYPDQGATKRVIAGYYARHADRVLEYLADRPLSLVRCPDGRDGQCFFQRHHTNAVPEGLEAIRIAEKNGKRAPYLIVRSAAGLIAATQIGALELHLWGARDDRLERPERIVFDLDPDPELPFDRVREAARELRDVLAAADLESFPLLTGGKGIHVIVPVERRRGWDEIRLFARGLAYRLARAEPKRYVAVAAKAKRRGRIFIDWLRNERGATAIAPYSLRARPGAPVATPVSWAELGRVHGADQYSLDNIDQRLARLGSDPWKGYGTVRQSITKRHLTAAGAA